MNKIIIGLTGPIASGKGTIKKYIEEKYKGTDCRFSSILRDVLARIDVSINRENLQKISTNLRQTFGEELLAKVIVSDAQKLQSKIVIIDGIRREADIAYLKDFEGFVLVSVDALPRIRFERMKKRNENIGDSTKSYKQFIAEHKAEADEQVPKVMKKASENVENSGDFDALFKQVDNIIKKYRNAK